MMPPIVLEPWEWEESGAILRAHLSGRRVWAYRSRATRRRVKRFSDLDLAVEGLTSAEAAALEEALEETRLPFKVDVAGLDALAPEFRGRIEPEIAPMQEPKSVE